MDYNLLNTNITLKFLAYNLLFPPFRYGDLPRMEQFTLAYIGAYLYTYGGGDLDNTI